ncbi:histidine kinase, partial [Raoultella planticola]
KQTQDYCAVLQSAHLMVIAEITTRQCALQCGDKLTPLANALYCLNDNPALTLKVIKATHFSSERWAEIAKSD